VGAYHVHSGFSLMRNKEGGRLPSGGAYMVLYDKSDIQAM